MIDKKKTDLFEWELSRSSTRLESSRQRSQTDAQYDFHRRESGKTDCMVIHVYCIALDFVEMVGIDIAEEYMGEMGEYPSLIPRYRRLKGEETKSL